MLDSAGLNMPSRSPMDVLVTRPGDAGRELCRLLTQSGGRSDGHPPPSRAIHCPLFELTAADTQHSLADQLADLRAACSIFVSVPAVRFTQPLLAAGGFAHGHDQSHDQSHNLGQLIAVGPATAAALREAGAEDVLLPRRHDSEGVLALPILKTPKPAAGPVALFHAPGGRTLIENTLEQRGWRVVSLPVYQRRALALPSAALDAVGRDSRPILVFTSATAMSGLLQALPVRQAGHVLGARWVVASRRLAETARAMGALEVTVAEGAGNPALLRAITTLTGGDGAHAPAQ